MAGIPLLFATPRSSGAGGGNELLYPPHGQVECVLCHVREAYPEPPRFRAVARRAWGYVEPDIVDDLLPEVDLRLERVRAQEVPHVDPAEQPGIALEAPYPGFL